MSDIICFLIYLFDSRTQGITKFALSINKEFLPAICVSDPKAIKSKKVLNELLPDHVKYGSILDVDIIMGAKVIESDLDYYLAYTHKLRIIELVRNIHNVPNTINEDMDNGSKEKIVDLIENFRKETKIILDKTYSNNKILDSVNSLDGIRRAIKCTYTLELIDEAMGE